VQVEVELLADRSHDRREEMARVLAADPAGEVEQAPPVGSLDPGALGTRDHELRCRDAARDVAFAPVERAGCGRLFTNGHSGDYPTAAGRATMAWQAKHGDRGGRRVE
jgi:hypothetical protein